jgi:cation:H+ antiporter
MTFPPLVLEGLSILGGIAFLVWGADRFVLGASALANNMGVSPLLIGLTIVGFGTSAPEMLVSAVAASQGSSGIAIGNAVGSNITNAALVLGASALVGPLAVHSKVIRRELPVLLLVSLGAYALMWDRHLGRGDGIVLLLCLIGMVSWVVREARMEGSEVSPDALSVEMEDEIPRDMSTPRRALLGGLRARDPHGQQRPLGVGCHGRGPPLQRPRSAHRAHGGGRGHQLARAGRVCCGLPAW